MMIAVRIRRILKRHREGLITDYNIDGEGCSNLKSYYIWGNKKKIRELTCFFSEVNIFKFKKTHQESNISFRKSWT